MNSMAPFLTCGSYTFRFLSLPASLPLPQLEYTLTRKQAHYFSIINYFKQNQSEERAVCLVTI